ncbi:MAG TPA: hypothetical protein PK358_10125 [Spirochaetota bacterium]|nr:hypothetical protein [Spirochaetota bacterium]HPJ35181.1 hypothetical protein [Spirochaetota bacterium]
MKRRIISAFSVFLLLAAAMPSFAVDISAGATTWYSWWDFEEDNTSYTPDIDPTLLYGPALSVKFNDEYNLTFVFLYGKFDMQEGEGSSVEITRIDSDLALNYRLNNYFKLFFGGKYMGYTQDNGFSHLGLGPGAGISAVFPMGWDFYLLGNVSGLYLWGNHEPSDDSTEDSTQKYNEYGFNSSLSLAYYIAPASVTLSIGGRYQYFKTIFEDSDDNEDMTHQFYGVTAAATYSFNL